MSMATETTRPGRPRDQRVDDAVRHAAVSLLDERGYVGLTVEDVAMRAGVSKSAIYRRWSNKAELVFDSAVHPLDLGAPDDTGALQSDLAAVLTAIVDALTRPGASAAVTGLLADVHANPELADRLLGPVVAAERAVLVTVLDRAVQRGELSRRPDPELVHALLLGPVFALVHLLRSRTVDVAVLSHTAACGVTALARPGPTADSSPRPPP